MFPHKSNLRGMVLSLNRLGKSLHLSNNGNLIFKTEKKPEIGDQVFDKELKKVGIVFDIFGPTSNPYVSVKPSVEKPEKYVGEVLYTMKTKRKRRRRSF